MDVSSLPFNNHLGLSISQADGKSAVILQPCAHHLNHLDTKVFSGAFKWFVAANGL